jgi:hypothetical protein
MTPEETPEERLNRIEKALDRHIAFVGANVERQTAEIDKNSAAIRDLTIVSRTLITAIQEQGEVQRRDHERVMADIDKLREAQAATEEKLKNLVETVDRIIRNRENGKRQ